MKKLLLLTLFLGQGICSSFEIPEYVQDHSPWWFYRGVIPLEPVTPDENLRPVIQGQLKNMAVQARDELEDKFGPSTSIDALVDPWFDPVTGDPILGKEKAIMNIGQVKAVAKIFYDHYKTLNIPVKLDDGTVVSTAAGDYPWPATTPIDLNLAPANIGQLKHLFSFARFADNFAAHEVDYRLLKAEALKAEALQLGNPDPNCQKLFVPPVPAISWPFFPGTYSASYVPANYVPGTPPTNSNYTDMSYTWNSNCLLPLRFACVKVMFNWHDNENDDPWGDGDHRRFQACPTAVTRSHFIGAWHAHYDVGMKIRFFNPLGGYTEHIIVSKSRDLETYINDPVNKQIVDDPTLNTLRHRDIYVCKFTPELPPSAPIAKILPDNWEDFFPSNMSGIPAFGFDQEGKVLVREISSMNSSGYLLFKSANNASTPLRNSYYELGDFGDSSTPSLLIINDEPVILCSTWHKIWDGYSIEAYSNEINTAIGMVDADHGTITGYTLSEVDLSGYQRIKP